MLNSRTFDELAHRIGQAIESSPAKDIERNVRAMLSSGLARLDLVPRAEFDTQSQVLLKTREKLEALERRVAELEARVGPSSASSSASSAATPASFGSAASSSGPSSAQTSAASGPSGAGASDVPPAPSIAD